MGILAMTLSPMAMSTVIQMSVRSNRIAKATDNAVVGNAEDVSQQILERFHTDDRLMLWFDFFNLCLKGLIIFPLFSVF